MSILPRLYMSVWLLCILVLVASCTKQGNITPKGVLSEAQMQNVLHDILIAEAVLYNHSPGNADAGNAASYYKYVFEKNHTDKQTFERSLKYYAEHADKMKDIYDNLVKDFENKELIKK